MIFRTALVVNPSSKNFFISSLDASRRLADLFLAPGGLPRKFWLLGRPPGRFRPDRDELPLRLREITVNRKEQLSVAPGRAQFRLPDENNVDALLDNRVYKIQDLEDVPAKPGELRDKEACRRQQASS